MTGVLISRDEETDTQGKCHVITEVQIGVTRLQDKEHQVLTATPEAIRNMEQIFP